MVPADLFAALPAQLTFTVDVEDHDAAAGPGRHVAATRGILDLLDRHGAKGTFFVVGRTAGRAPALVREIARRGHEVASHGHRHVPLTREDDPDAFRRETTRARLVLEDLAGTPVLGFRAAVFSLTSRTLWAVDALREAGFAYSSSVLPARSLAYGLPGAPDGPFRWPNGLLELPCPVGRAGPLAMPCLGGMYLRFLPPWRLRQLARSIPPEAAVWTYCHPYDVDLDEPWLARVPLAGPFTRRNRGVAARRLAALMAGRTSVPFRDLLPALAARAIPFTPSPSQPARVRAAPPSR